MTDAKVQVDETSTKSITHSITVGNRVISMQLTEINGHPDHVVLINRPAETHTLTLTTIHFCPDEIEAVVQLLSIAEEWANG
jgi:hypothetical protein